VSHLRQVQQRQLAQRCAKPCDWRQVTRPQRRAGFAVQSQRLQRRRGTQLAQQRRQKVAR